MARPSLPLAQYAALLRRNRNFRLLWFAQIISELGDWFYSIAIYSLLIEFTGRAQSVAFALILQVLPQTIMSPIAGAMNDRASRKRVMITASVCQFFVVATMQLVRSPSHVWLIYVLLFLETLGWAFFEPARSAVIPNVAREDELMTANTLASVTWSLNLAIGSALGGVVAVALGRRAVFMIDACSYLAAALLVTRMRFEEPHVASSGGFKWREMFDISPVSDGLRYVAARRARWTTMLAKTGTAILGSSWVLFPVMGEKTFPVEHLGVLRERGAMLGMSVLMGARGVGALLGPLATANWAATNRQRLRLGILLGFLVSGVGYLALARVQSLAAAISVIVLAHMGGSVVWVFSTTLLQLNTEDGYRGRVFSAELALSMLALSLVSYGVGQALDAGVAARTIAAITGVGMLVPSICWAFLSHET